MSFLNSGTKYGPAAPAGRKGQIAVFLSVILLALMMLAAVLTDLSRVAAGRELAKKAVNSAARSVLAEYGGKLAGDYGLFALAEKDGSILEKAMEKYISKNLTIPAEDGEYGSRLDPYGFRIEEVRVTPLYNLGENGVFKSQILEYMKYRAPKELVEGFIEKLAIFGQVGKMSEAYKKKVSADRLLGRMDRSQQSLKKKVDGDGKAGEVFVNGFNAAGAWMEAFSRFQSLCGGLEAVKKSIAGLDARIAQLRALPGGPAGPDAGGENGSGGADDTADLFKRLAEEREALAGKAAEIRASLESSWDDIRYGLTGDYLKPNREAYDEVGRIADAGEKAGAALSELEEYLSENFGAGDSFSEDFVRATDEEVKRLRELILSGEKANDILGGLAGNTGILGELADRLDRIKSLLDGSQDFSGVSGLFSGIGGLVGEYENIAYSYEKPVKGDAAADPRGGKREEAEKALSDRLSDDRNYLDRGIKQLDLPSFTKLRSEDFAEEDRPYLTEESSGAAHDAGGSGGAAPAAPAAYPGDLARVGESADLYDEEDAFQENSLGFIGDIGKIAAGELSALRDNVYLNEYIMGVFRNSVPVVVSSSGTADEDKDFQGRVKNGRETFYEGEVEYILHGNPSENTNKLMTRGQILLVRFGLNTLHVYTDAKKRELASGTAAAVAGWWTGGAGIPILANLIMAGWAMGESILDMKELLDGKSVPAYKLEGDWKLDIGLGKGGPKTDPRLCFSYHDYLRLLLMAESEEKKLGRMEDIIQLNMGESGNSFRISECKTAVRVEAVVSMKYLFLNRAFIPASVRTEDGRHKFGILVYEGY